MSRHRTTAAAVLFLLVLGWAVPATTQAAVPRLVFPVLGKASFVDDFGAPRGTGAHEGNDLMAKKKTKVVAAETGTVTKWTKSANAGCMLYLKGWSGTLYLYIHLNNDRTMRNDTHGNSTCVNGIAYAPGLRSGQTVRAGQLLGYVGDSGDADGIASHLHFELHPGGGRAVSPYRRLRAARHHLYARPTTAVTTLTATVFGRVAFLRTDTNPDRLRVRVDRVLLSNGWWVRPARSLTVSIAADASVRRRSTNGTVAAAGLGELSAGERVTLGIVEFRQSLVYARAPAALHLARSILIRD
jgi:hypothetical protein